MTFPADSAGARSNVPDGAYRFIALDVETACNDASSICQIGIACVRPDNSIDTCAVYVNPRTHFSPFNIQLHGIGPDHVKDAPDFGEVIAMFEQLLARHQLIQHSAFDKRAVYGAYERAGLAAPDWRWSDSVQIARKAWPEFVGNGGHGLAHLKKRLGLSFQHHDAGEDARAAAMVVLQAEERLQLSFDQIIRAKAKGAAVKRSVAPAAMDGPLRGAVVVFTGRLSMPAEDAARLAAAAGMAVGRSITRKTTHLIVGDQDLAVLTGDAKSDEHRKAEAMQRDGHDIRVLGETEFKRLAAGNGR